MRVGFDVSALYRPHPPGVVRLVRALVPLLERRGRLEVLRLAPMLGDELRHWRQVQLVRDARRFELDGIHSFTSAFPLRGRGARVQTIHELPWQHGVAENAGWRHRAWARFGPFVADRVVTASEHVAGALRARMGVHKLRVIPWGVGPPFAPEPPPGAVDEPVLARHRLGEDPLLTCLGAVRAKKNLAALLRGYAELRARGGPRVQIVVTGPDTPDLRRDLGLASQLGLARFVATPGELPEEDLAPLLRLSSAVVVLSRSEGFAFPVLEAFACGTPVLVARLSAQAELAGPLGISVDPADPASVASGIAAALERREALRYQLPARAAEFPWDLCAERIETLWSELAP